MYKLFSIIYKLKWTYDTFALGSSQLVPSLSVLLYNTFTFRIYSHVTDIWLNLRINFHLYFSYRFFCAIANSALTSLLLYIQCKLLLKFSRVVSDNCLDTRKLHHVPQLTHLYHICFWQHISLIRNKCDLRYLTPCKFYDSLFYVIHGDKEIINKSLLFNTNYKGNKS